MVAEGKPVDSASEVGVAENAEVASEVAAFPAVVVIVWRVLGAVSWARVRVVRRRKRRVVNVVGVGKREAMEALAWFCIIPI